MWPIYSLLLWLFAFLLSFDKRDVPNFTKYVILITDFYVIEQIFQNSKFMKICVYIYKTCMYVHALRFYLSHLSLYQFGDFYIWCETSICFIFSPFNFSLCGYLIILAPFIAKIVFPHCCRIPLQHKSNISICLSLYLVFLFGLIGSPVPLSISTLLQLSF